MNYSETTTVPAGDECYPSGDDIERNYNLKLHIASLFVILVVSLLGASISVISTRVKALYIHPVIINTGKFFGSGVVLATGFIHMWPAAMEALTDPCLPDSWNVYGAYAGLFAMLAALGMQLIEFLAHQRYQSVAASTNLLSANQNLPQVTHTKDAVQIVVPPVGSADPHAGHQHGMILQDDAQRHRVSTYLLEFGIALHSVLIGVALGTNVNEFVALFIALCFHQFFEGMALGTQIARVKNMRLTTAITMVVFFAITTPVGIAIGIGIHSKAYNPKSVAALLVNGILDSISAGILIYVALVNLITAEMGANAISFHVLKMRLKLLYFAALYLGAGAMAVIGRWA